MTTFRFGLAATVLAAAVAGPAGAIDLDLGLGGLGVSASVGHGSLASVGIDAGAAAVGATVGGEGGGGPDGGSSTLAAVSVSLGTAGTGRGGTTGGGTDIGDSTGGGSPVIPGQMTRTNDDTVARADTRIADPSAIRSAYLGNILLAREGSVLGMVDDVQIGADGRVLLVVRLSPALGLDRDRALVLLPASAASGGMIRLRLGQVDFIRQVRAAG